jgi:hypothetical protein
MQTQFSIKMIILFYSNSKNNKFKYLKCSPNIYISVVYRQLNFQSILIFFETIYY